MLGSVAEEVVRTAPCSVLTVRATDGTLEVYHPQRLLVPVDFSEHARLALIYAKDLARRFDARIDLLHVVEHTLQPGFYNTGLVTAHDLEPEMEARIREHLERFYREAPGAAADPYCFVVHGHAAVQIAEHAREQETDLIVIATHGLTGLEHFFLGSVTEKVVRTAPCPVFTAKGFGTSLLAPNAEQALNQSEA